MLPWYFLGVGTCRQRVLVSLSFPMRTLIPIWGLHLHELELRASAYEFGETDIQLITLFQPSGFLPTLLSHPLAKRLLSLNILLSDSSSLNSFIHLCRHYSLPSFPCPHSLQVLLAGSEMSFFASAPDIICFTCISTIHSKSWLQTP